MSICIQIKSCALHEAKTLQKVKDLLDGKRFQFVLHISQLHDHLESSVCKVWVLKQVIAVTCQSNHKMQKLYPSMQPV